MATVSTICVDLRLKSGRVRDVAISPVGARAPAASFIGLAAGAVPARAALLYALCPVSQKLAAEAAIAAARGESLAPDRDRSIALLAEHCRENFRSLVLSWPGLVPDSETLSVVRVAHAAARDLADLAPADMRAKLEVLSQSATKLGFTGPAPAPSTWAGRLRESVANDAGRTGGEATALFLDEPGPDEAVFEALATGLAASPATSSAIALTELLRTRMAAIGATIAQLRRLAANDCGPLLCSARSLGGGAGAAAVVSPRGRLFHIARIDGAGRVVSYRTLSPTDRNFATGGPLARSLAGLEIGSGAAAEGRVAQIAAFYDPCVAVHVNIREMSHA